MQSHALAGRHRIARPGWALVQQNAALLDPLGETATGKLREKLGESLVETLTGEFRRNQGFAFHRQEYFRR
jgi:hypothetical protein